MITYQHGFDPAAQYRVTDWRGFTHDGRQYRENELVSTAQIPADILFTLMRFGTVRKHTTAGASTVDTPHATPTSPSAPGTQATAATATPVLTSTASIGISVEPQPRHEAGVTATHPPRDRKWLATATTDELRQECEVRGLDTRGDKSQLRGRLFPLVG